MVRTRRRVRRSLRRAAAALNSFAGVRAAIFFDVCYSVGRGTLVCHRPAPAISMVLEIRWCLGLVASAVALTVAFGRAAPTAILRAHRHMLFCTGLRNGMQSRGPGHACLNASSWHCVGAVPFSRQSPVCQHIALNCALGRGSCARSVVMWLAASVPVCGVLVAGGTYSMLEDFSALPTQRNCTAHYRVRVFVAATWSACVDSAATVVLCTSRVS